MAETGTTERLIGRTLRNLRGAWQDIAQSALGLISAADGFHPDLSDADLERLRARFRDCLEARGGEVSARARAADLGRAYLGLSRAGRERFLRVLAADFDVDHDAVAAAAARLAEASDSAARREIEARLRRLLDPPRRRLLTQFNALPEGVKFLVDLRADAMEFGRADAAIAALEDDLRALLAAWFDVGFLELRRITWDSPASLLEKLSVYEAVHAVRGWADLKNRLDSDRRCFAFFHPRMPDEPLIFVEVALVDGMSGNVGALLDESAPVGDPKAADTAIFYSISNAHRGLAGISFGGFLIKRVVDVLSAEWPQLRTFATLSPLPGFRAWLDRRFAEGKPGMLTRAERAALAAAFRERAAAEGVGESRGGKGLLKAALADHAWAREPALAAALKAPALRLAAEYLLSAKRGERNALDPVAHFHLSNGARIERLNWLADTSPKGLEQSAGIMVNYRYDLDDIEKNHEAYVGAGTIAASSTVRGLL